MIKPKKTIPAITEFVDIAGLVKGASKGEGLGNQFLGHIRQVGAIAHVVRCFDDQDIIHVNGKVNPIDDIEVINTELALADLESVTKKLASLPKAMKSHDKAVSSKAKALMPLAEKLESHLSEGKGARSLDFSNEDLELVNELQLITMKKQFYVCNVDEDGLTSDNAYVEQVKEYAAQEKTTAIKICGKLESEISVLDSEEEKQEFLKDMGLEEPGLNMLVRQGYELLNLHTYFTAGEKEVRAWTFPEGSTAPQCAGIIHTDFERGFIRAEAYHCDVLFEQGSEKKIKELGKLRVEGKEYIVQDGDVLHFRFNV